MPGPVNPTPTGAAVASRRDRRRAETEDRIVDAASALFVTHGYAGTSMTAVAERAELAERTVYVRFATKANLLQRCIGRAIAGDAAPVPLGDRDWMVGTRTAPTCAERLRAMAAVTAGLMERAGPLLRVAQQAAATEPALAAAAEAGREDTRRHLGEFWRAMADDGLLPPGCDLPWLTETATVLAHADTYLLLAATTGWTPAEYGTWLATTWSRLVDGSDRPVA